MADFNLPTVDDSYTNYLAYLKNRDVDLAKGMDPAKTTVTNPQTDFIRWNSANGYWEIYNGTSWGALAATYQINVAQLGGFAASAYARLASPVFTGTPQAPTAAVDTNTIQIATCQFVVGQGYLKSATAASTYAPIASPTFTGTPVAPTASYGTNTTQLATTQFVQSAAQINVSTITGNVTLTVADRHHLKTITAAAAVTAPATSTLINGDWIDFKNNTTAAVTLERQGSDTFDGVTQYRIPAYALVRLVKTGANTYVLAIRPDHDVGDIKAFAGSSAPLGWAFCDNVTLNRTTYGNLFAVIGTTYGVGDGSTTFGKPDLRGRVPAGRDDMGGTAANRLTSGGSGITGTALGSSGGAETHTLTTAQMPVHNHGVSDPTHNHGHNAGTVTGSVTVDNTGAKSTTTAATPNSGATINASGVNISIQNTGSGNAHPNTQPTMVVNYIIKL
jgi:microcystin-dependent protein